MLLSVVLNYIAISALVASTPGPSNILALRNGARYGAGIAALAITGHMLAVAILAMITALGVGAIIIANTAFFAVIKMVGVGYLLWLGFNMLRSKPSTLDSAAQNSNGQTTVKPKVMKLWLEHFAIAATNPKALLFFSALFPQFVDINKGLTGQFMVFLLISLCSSFIFPFSYALMAKKVASSKTVARRKNVLGNITGVSFVGFGIALAMG